MHLQSPLQFAQINICPPSSEYMVTQPFLVNYDWYCKTIGNCSIICAQRFCSSWARGQRCPTRFRGVYPGQKLNRDSFSLPSLLSSSLVSPVNLVCLSPTPLIGARDEVKLERNYDSFVRPTTDWLVANAMFRAVTAVAGSFGGELLPSFPLQEPLPNICFCINCTTTSRLFS